VDSRHWVVLPADLTVYRSLNVTHGFRLSLITVALSAAAAAAAAARVITAWVIATLFGTTV